MNITVKDVFTLNITPRYRRLHKINNYLFVLMMKNRNNIFTCVCVGVCVCVCVRVCVCVAPQQRLLCKLTLNEEIIRGREGSSYHRK